MKGKCFKRAASISPDALLMQSEWKTSSRSHTQRKVTPIKDTSHTRGHSFEPLCHRLRWFFVLYVKQGCWEGQENKQVAQSPCCLLRPPSSHQSTAAAGSKSRRALWQSSGACMTWKCIENAQMTWKCTQVGCKASLHGRKTERGATAIRPGNCHTYLKRVGLACQIWLWGKMPQHTESLFTTCCLLICTT